MGMEVRRLGRLGRGGAGEKSRWSGGECERIVAIPRLLVFVIHEADVRLQVRKSLSCRACSPSFRLDPNGMAF